jgi:serine/threonine protein kinase
MSENAPREARMADSTLDKCPGCNLLLLEPVPRCPSCGADFTQKPEIPGYRIEAGIGEDRWGPVYQAFRKSDGFEFELHIIDPDRIGGEGALDPLVERIREFASLIDIHLVLVKGAGRTESAAYFLTEKPRGEPLSRMLERTPRLSEMFAVKIVLDVARAFDELERQGVRHGRITPRDIVIEPDGSAQLKLAAVADLFLKTAPALFENAEDLVYAAPEELTFGAKGFLSDQYSLGAVLYRALLGAPPFQGADAEQVKTKVLMTRPPPPRGVSPGMRDLLGHMLAKDVETRYPTPAALYKAAGRLGAAILAKRTTGIIPPVAPDESPTS